jgi:purine-binding chemotaxis protein CheW
MSGNHNGAQFVTLGLDREVFAVPVEFVREILDMRTPFHIPEAPAHLAGLIDVRGRAVPVIDLRLKLGLAPREPGSDTRIVVLDVPVGNRTLSLGLIADRVFEVTALDQGDIGPPPDIGSAWHSEYIQGIGRRGDSFVVIFDLSRLLSSEDVALLRAAGSRAPGSSAPGSSTPVLAEA